MGWDDQCLLLNQRNGHRLALLSLLVGALESLKVTLPNLLYFKLLFSFGGMGVLSACVYIYIECMLCPRRPEEGIGFPELELEIVVSR